MIYQHQLLHNSQRPFTLVAKPTFVMYNMLNEDNSNTLVPRFTMKNSEIFPEFPSNTPLKFSQELIIKAIEYGMIIQIDYKGDADGNQAGHQRTIYPMVFGRSKQGKYVLRGYHLNGWSVSQGGPVEQEWRMFRCDRILNITFSGAFYRLAPEGYNSTGDKGITRIIKQANFETIRAKQGELLGQQKVDTLERTVLNKIKSVEVKDLKYVLKTISPWQGNVIPKKDAKNIRMTFAKPLMGTGQYICIIGTSIGRNNIFKLKVDGKEVGSYKSVKWMMGDRLAAQEPIEQQVEFKTYMFLKAI